ncbi:efflux RND transporter periplasmic adaptor subunit [Halarcobacter anaerophilus]|jgi:RND family efflux transporter MFP subunit|uniref:Efflux transporter periplasmic adaptor subunit n=1 Tax=Halarcobacter anaerophilus TaxID=877500 RepID=A0A4Q0XUZ2_9BACT|nr:efflux RND transporter periplasmic adaptor subunit [Halarcobacter anaerophilus]QDF28467.1 putative fusaric acid resistance efflux pump, membrane fusion protein [Halarcobacter anaerophilus]RXJ61306.1 efflux transporter periplasmic adaptor subunit [Halarcobacter anaerophilus]
MNNKFVKLLRYIITFSIVTIAALLTLKLWHNYVDSPWTRDGRIRADITLVAPDVAGIITKVYVKDNQYVKQGEKLFEIDKKRFEANISKLSSIVNLKEANYKMRKAEYYKRSLGDDSVIAKDVKDDAKYKLLMAKEELNEAVSKLELAKLDLQRSTIFAPTNGWINNLLVKQGDFIKVGQSHLSILNENSFWVYGYFEEHKIPKIHVGDEAIMQPMGTDFTIKGHVESIASGITDRDNQRGAGLLANVDPSFTWVRLAQRIPVRIAIDEVPKEYILRAGTTCIIEVLEKNKDEDSKEKTL